MLELFASDNFAGPLDERLQDLSRLALEPQLDAMLSQLARAHVKLEDTESQDPVSIARAVGRQRGHQPRPLTTARRRSNSYHQKD